MSSAVFRPILAGVGGSLMAVSGFVAWPRRGAGSTMSGLELASVLRRTDVAPPGARWIAAGLIAVPIIGALAVVSAGITTRLVTVTIGFTAAAVLAVLAILAVGGSLPFDHWSVGPRLALIGSILVMTSGLSAILGQRF